VRRERERRAAAPAPDELGGQQFPFVLGAAVLVQESVERAHARVIDAHSHVGAVAAEDVRLRHRQRRSGLAGIAEDELAGLDGPALAREWIDAAALDGRLVDAVLVAERIEIAGLRAEVLHGHDADARQALILLAGNREGPPPLLLGIAERADSDVHLPRRE